MSKDVQLDREFYPSVIEGLAGNQVFSIKKMDNGLFKFTENCDYYYDILLTSQDLRDLAAELVLLADSPPKP